jgi:secreted trypsin-like serine protease
MTGGVLNLGVVDLISNADCLEDYPGDIDETMICAGTLPDHDDVDACQGDSGGPLVIKVGTDGVWR